MTTTTTVCPECDGDGFIANQSNPWLGDDCPRCHGDGEIPAATHTPEVTA